MADVKLSTLPVDSTLATTDVIPVVDVTNTTTKKSTLATLISFFFKNVQTSDMAAALATSPVSRNCAINGNFDVWQRGATFTTPASAAYTADRWLQIQKANAAWTFSQDSTTAPTTSRYSMKAVNVTLNNQCGLVQFLELADVIPLRGQTVSLTFWAKTSALTISNLRATVLQWAGTADSVTRPVVTTWNAAGNDPTWATNWSAAIAGSNQALTNSWTQYKIENIPISSTANNLAIVIWTDDSVITAADTFWLAQVQLNLGVKVLPFMPKDYRSEFADCQRYYQDHGSFAYRIYHNNVHRYASLLPVQMRATPTTVHTFSAVGLAADNSAGLTDRIAFDTQFTAAGTGVVDATVNPLTFDAEL